MAQSPFDHILVGGTFLTMDPNRPTVSALGISGGLIRAIGERDDILALAGDSTRVEELVGATVIPGLIDAHNHLLMTGRILQQVQLYDCRSIDDILARVRAAVDAAPAGAWILGRGWDESLLGERRYPSRHDLDRVSPDHPVVLHRVWNKLVANSRALDLAGISRETPDPPADAAYAGSFDRDADGEPTGLFRDRAKELVTAAVPIPSPQELVEAIGVASREYNRLGITAVSEPGLFPEEVRAFNQAANDGVLTVRTAMSLAGWGFGTRGDDAVLEARLGGVGLLSGFGGELLWLDGVKLMPDGGVGDRTARMFEPYEGEPDNRGQWVVPPDELHERIRLVHDLGLAMDIHTCGDEAQEVVVQAFADAQTANPNPRLRHRVHHAYLPTEATLAAMAAHAIPAVVSNPFLTHLGESYRTSIGDERAARMMPMRTYLDRAVPLAGSSDSPVATHNPWEGVYAAVTRTTVAGAVLGADQALTVDEALSMYTEGGAFVLGRESSLGSLVPGKEADLVLLDADPRAVDPEGLRRTEPLATMVGGNWVFDRR